MPYPSVIYPADNPELDFIHTNENTEIYFDVPTFFTFYNVTSYPKDLINDDTNLYYTYSGGWNITTVGKQKQTRYKNITLRAVSGDSFNFYFKTGDLDANNCYLSGPLTSSGSYYFLTEYTTEPDALTNAITFTNPMNSGILVFPSYKDLTWISLMHSGASSYRLYQYLPRTFIQVDDLEADVIDAVTVRVSDSIVIGPNMIGDKTILGQKIVDGTLSGVLITDGTVTGSKIVANTISGVLIAANTITADRLSVTQLDAVAANMGNLTVNSGISIGTQGYLWAGTGSASSPTTGLKIYTTSGVSRLTTYSGGISQVDIGSDGRLYAGSGQTLKLDSNGITFKSTTTRSDLDWVQWTPPPGYSYPPQNNVVKFHPYNYTALSGVVTLSEDTSGSAIAFLQNTELWDYGSPTPSTQNTYLGSSTRLRSGWLPSESGNSSMYKLTHQSNLTVQSFAKEYASINIVAGTDTLKHGVYITPDNIDLQAPYITATRYDTYYGVSSPFYGSGADGAVNFQYGNIFTFATYNSTTNTYTLTRDLYATTINVAYGTTVITAGFRVFATVSIVVDGYMHNDGGHASGAIAGAAALGSYYRASLAGATGLGAAATGVGTAPAIPTAATFVGSLGGRGASARSSTIASVSAVPITQANYNLSDPLDVDGGRHIVNDVNFWKVRSLNTATAQWQPTASMGGASGSKSIVGTSATSGAGGGGGGFVFVASPSILAYGLISAKGGNGGNATGTGGNFGGGGGGGGGVIGVITDHATYDSTMFDVAGGVGGSSISLGVLSPVAANNGTSTSTTSTEVTIAPTNAFTRNTTYVLAIHIQGTSIALPTVNSVIGGGLEWFSYADVPYHSDVIPTKRLVVFIGKIDANSGYSAPYSENPWLKISFSEPPVSVRYNIDAVYNTAEAESGNPVAGITTQLTNSAVNITTDLGYVPTTNYMQYTVVARAGGTTPVAGTGNTLVNNQTVAPLLASEVSVNRQTNSMSWTTAAAAAAVTFDFAMPTTYEPGTDGERGKVVAFLV